MMKKIIQVTMLLLALFSGIGLSCKSGDSWQVATVSVGTTISEVNSLILIAQEKGYFTDNGIALTQKIYSSGIAALDGMFNHEVDLATGSEFAFVGEVLSEKHIRTISAISRSSIEYLVGRVDRGIKTLANLRGKSIGVPLGSRPEFALDRFLFFHNIDPSTVNLVNVPVSKSVDALTNGEVDAIASWQPYIDQIKNKMGEEVVSWDVQEDQPSYTLVMCTEEWTAENPELIIRFLKSLTQAESYVQGNPVEAEALIQQRLNYDISYMDAVWHDYSFSVSLDQALVVAMEDQARWIIGKDYSSGKQTPNFMSYIYVEGLEEIKPEAVNVVH
jgi:NitT/TauT family transport system substrate-binding protein